MSQSMGLAAPGYVQHRLFMRPHLAGQCQPGHIPWYQPWHIQTISSLAFLSFWGWEALSWWRQIWYRMWHAVHTCCPYHLNRPLRRTVAISLMPSSLSSEAEGVSSWTFVPQIQWIMPWSLRQSRLRSKVFGTYVSLPWSIGEWAQAMYTLPCTLGERHLEMRTGNSFLNFPQATHDLAAMALSQPPPEHSMSPR